MSENVVPFRKPEPSENKKKESGEETDNPFAEVIKKNQEKKEKQIEERNRRNRSTKREYRLPGKDS